MDKSESFSESNPRNGRSSPASKGLPGRRADRPDARPVGRAGGALIEDGGDDRETEIGTVNPNGYSTASGVIDATHARHEQDRN